MHFTKMVWTAAMLGKGRMLADREQILGIMVIYQDQLES